jgi:hypothetical protein
MRAEMIHMKPSGLSIHLAVCVQVATIYAKQKLKAQRGKPQQRTR